MGQVRGKAQGPPSHPQLLLLRLETVRPSVVPGAVRWRSAADGAACFAPRAALQVALKGAAPAHKTDGGSAGEAAGEAADEAVGEACGPADEAVGEAANDA